MDGSLAWLPPLSLSLCLSLWLTTGQFPGRCPPSSTWGTDTDNRCRPPYLAPCRTPPCKGHLLSTCPWVWSTGSAHAHTNTRALWFIDAGIEAESGQDLRARNIHGWQENSLHSCVDELMKKCQTPNGCDLVWNSLHQEVKLFPCHGWKGYFCVNLLPSFR